MTILLVAIAVMALAYANGANDNFKGVATLFGSGTTNYRRALLWATAATFAGSATAVVLAGSLLKSFRGKGLVDDALITEAAYLGAVALGASVTVLLASKIGMPVSTTHSLVGSLIGAALAAGSEVHVGRLGMGFVAPLLLSPVLAITFAILLYSIFRIARRRLGVTEQTCICIGREPVEYVPAGNRAMALARVEQLRVTAGDQVSCRERYVGRVFGIRATALVDRMHFATAGMVSYARGLNDTPKIAALLLVVPNLGGLSSTLVVGSAIALGGWLSARKVAVTMSQKITTMNHGQGFTANLVTGAIVIGASRLGLPVSTTHVSCGSLFGLGAVTGRGNLRTIGTVLSAWVTTLPVSAALGMLGYHLLRSMPS